MAHTKSKNKGTSRTVTLKSGQTLTGSAAANYGKSSSGSSGGSSSLAPLGSQERTNQLIAQSKAMLNQTAAEGSKPFRGSSYDTNPTITASILDSKVSPIEIPTPPAFKDVGSMAGAGNIELGGVLGDNYKVGKDAMISLKPVNTEAELQQQSIGNMRAMLGMIPEKESVFNSKEYRQGNALVEQRQQEVNDAIATLNSIVTKQQQDLISTRGQASANGVTEAVYGGIQNEINRNAALAALPVQAQVAAAQGNLELAEKHLDTVYRMKSEEINNKYDYKKAQLNAISGFLDKQEKRQWDLLDRKYDEEKQDKQNSIKEQSDYAKMAMSTGQSQLGAQIAQLDYKSPTFKADLARLQGQIKDPMLELDRQLKIAQIGSADRANQPEIPDGGDVSELMAFAKQYASTGKIPTGIPKGSFGLISQLAAGLPKLGGQILDSQTGVAPDGSDGAVTALGSLNSAAELAKQLKELDKERIGGVVSGVLGKTFGNEDQRRYVDLRSQIVDLLSRARSGAALTSSEEKRYGAMLPGRFSEPFGLGTDSDARIDNFINALQSDLTNKLSARGWVLNPATDEGSSPLDNYYTNSLKALQQTTSTTPMLINAGYKF